jgi:hypothetical protein
LLSATRKKPVIVDVFPKGADLLPANYFGGIPAGQLFWRFQTAYIYIITTSKTIFVPSGYV